MRLLRHLACVLLPLAGCPLESARDSGVDCSRKLRTPAPRASVMRAPPTGPASQLAASCGSPSCLRVLGRVVAVLQPDRTIWATWEGQPGTLLDAANARAPVDPKALDTWVQQTVSAATPAGGPAENAPPVLPPEFRSCGTTSAGGGFGHHVILNDGSVWQRIHWSRPPTDKDVLALPPNAYPIANAKGALCAYGTQRTPRNWEIHLVNHPLVVTAAADKEHAPAHCLANGAVQVQTPGGKRWFSADGKELPVPAQGAPANVAAYDGPSVPAFHTPTLELRGANGDSITVPLPQDGRDLAGNDVGPQASRTRLTSMGNGRGQVLVAERFTLRGCTGMEALHVVDLGTRKATTLARGDHVFHRLQALDGVFYWLQSRPHVVDLDSDAPTPVDL